jgi:hypothetical protein
MRVIGCLCLALLNAAWAQASGWRGIAPLHSTRADVERLLGPATRGDAYSSIYDLKDAYVSVQFSGGPCSNGWDAPAGTVTSVSVTPKPKPLFSRLKLNMKGYRRIDDVETPGAVHYVNEEEGVTYEVQSDRVVVIFYVPQARDKHLRCTPPPEQQPNAFDRASAFIAL